MAAPKGTARRKAAEKPQATRTRRVAASTRAEIISLATAFFADSSYHAASLRQLADRAGIRAASIYYHFKSKEELLASIIIDTVDDLFRELSEIMADNVDPRERLRRIVTAHLRHCVSRPEETRLILEQSHFLGPDTLDAVRAKQRMMFEFYRNCIAACFAPGAEGVQKPSVLALNALGVINNFARWARPDPEKGFGPITDQTTSFILAAVFEHSRYEAHPA